MGSLNPFALLMGGGSFFTLAAMMWGLKLPLWVRVPGMAVCVAFGLTAFAIAIMRGFQKKAPPPRYTSKKAPPVSLPPEVAGLKTTPPPRASKAGARSKSPRGTPP
jgi:hypothetical protein